MTNPSRKTRTFTMRNIPKQIHGKWKAAAAMRGGISMEEFALVAIELVANNVLASMREDLRAASASAAASAAALDADVDDAEGADDADAEGDADEENDNDVATR